MSAKPPQRVSQYVGNEPCALMEGSGLRYLMVKATGNPVPPKEQLWSEGLLGIRILTGAESTREILVPPGPIAG